MLPQATIDDMQESCSAVAHSNWDGYVKITQAEDGVLTFVLYSEEDEVDGFCTATLVGEFQGHFIYSLKYQGEDGDRLDQDEPAVITTLVPVVVVGFLGL
jgi:hypothetical protein